MLAKERISISRTLTVALAASFLIAPLPAASEQPPADNRGLGLTDTDFLRAINSIGLKVPVVVIDKTDDDPKFDTNLVTYGFGPCVTATAETDAKTKHILSMGVAPTADDNSGCSADDHEMKNLVFVVAVEIMRVVSTAHDITKIGDAFVTLAQRLQRDPNSGMRSAEMKLGGRTVQMMSLLNDSRVEFRIYAE
jgi:hypothetical protein